MKNFKSLAGVSVMAVSLGSVAGVYAADSTQLSVEVTPGTLTVDITDGTGATVASPAITMSGTTAAFSDQTSTGTLGTASEQIVVSNPTDTEAWDVTIAATEGATYSRWMGAVTADPLTSASGTGTVSGTGTAITGSGTSFTTELAVGDQFTVGGEDRIVAEITSDTALTLRNAFTSDPSASAFTFIGCPQTLGVRTKAGFDINSNGALDTGECRYYMDYNETNAAGNAFLNVDASSGSGTTKYIATINPADGSISGETADPTGVSTNATATDYVEGTTDSITIFSADGTADDYNVYLMRGATLTQNVPAMQEADTYTIDLTLTVS